MSFVTYTSALIAAALTIPALVALYFLKLRRRPMPVPSTLLWQKAIQDMQVNTPFQRLRRNLLLLLQGLILLALLLALAGPTLWASAGPGERVVIVLDHSASMNAPASPGGPTRLENAKDAARRVVDSLASGDGDATRAMLVAFADRPRVLANFTGDPARLRQAIDRIEPTDQRSRLAPALELVEPYANEAAADKQRGLNVHVISDGRVHQQQARLPSLPGASLNFVQVAQNSQPDNLAIVACAARRSFETPEKVQVFARLANFADKPIDTNLTLSIDGETERLQKITVPAAGMRKPQMPTPSADQQGSDQQPQPTASFTPGTRSLQFEFTLAGEALIELSSDHTDALAADNTAALTLAPAKRLRALLVTDGNPFLERVIESVGVQQLTTMSAAEYGDQDPSMLTRADRATTTGGSGDGFDVVIFDGIAPQTLPPMPTLSFGAVPPIDGLALQQPAGDEQGGQAILDWQRQHPAMRYVALDDVVLADRSWLALPDDATVLATAQRGPVIAQMPEKGRPHVVVSFPVLKSNWPMQVSFPVFMSNVLQQLGLGGLLDDAGRAYRTGETVAVPVTDNATTIEYDGPVQLNAETDDGQAVLGPFTHTGVYQTDAGVETPFDRIAVNLLDTTESDLRPVETLQVASGSVQGKSSARAVQQPIWPWFVWAALAVLLLEWLLYTRRMRV